MSIFKVTLKENNELKTYYTSKRMLNFAESLKESGIFENVDIIEIDDKPAPKHIYAITQTYFTFVDQFNTKDECRVISIHETIDSAMKNIQEILSVLKDCEKICNTGRILQSTEDFILYVMNNNDRYAFNIDGIPLYEEIPV